MIDPSEGQRHFTVLLLEIFRVFVLFLQVSPQLKPSRRNQRGARSPEHDRRRTGVVLVTAGPHGLLINHDDVAN